MKKKEEEIEKVWENGSCDISIYIKCCHKYASIQLTRLLKYNIKYYITTFYYINFKNSRKVYVSQLILFVF